MITNSVSPLMIEKKYKGDEKESRRISSDVLLQMARRIDWRFLFPDPDLNEVVYLGLQRYSLIEALNLFSDSLTIIHHQSLEVPPNKKYQTIVACSPTTEMLDLIPQLIFPGGNLYIEAYGLWGFLGNVDRMKSWLRLQRQGLRFPNDYLMYVQRLGFSDARIFWHWPDFETCTKIIPLKNKEVIRYAIKIAGTGLENRLKAKIGLGLITSGWFKWFVPCFSIIAR